MRRNHGKALAAALAALLPGGCSILSEGLAPAPKSEIPREARDGYLKAGPVTGVDHGPAQRSLLKEYVETKDRLKEMGDRLRKLQEKLKAAQAALAECRKERDQERAGRIGAEAERDKALRDLRDKEIQLLNLALEKTKVEQELVALKIRALEGGGAAAPPPEAEGQGLGAPMGGGLR